MKITKNMLWCDPFIKSVKDLIPLEKLVKVSGYIVPFGKEAINDGSLYKTGNRYTLQVRLNYCRKPTKKAHYERCPLPGILDTLAHELAHIQEWEHSVEHMKLQYRIMQRFANVIKKKYDSKDYYTIKYWRV